MAFSVDSPLNIVGGRPRQPETRSEVTPSHIAPAVCKTLENVLISAVNNLTVNVCYPIFGFLHFQQQTFVEIHSP